MPTTWTLAGLRLTDLGETRPTKGQPVGGSSDEGVAALYEVTGPDDLRLTLGDRRWRSGPRDLSTLESHTSPERFDRLKHGLVVLAEEGLASGQVSPFMVCHLLEVALVADTCDFIALDHLIARADACFAFDWKHLEPELDAVSYQARQRFAHAVMRGIVQPTACPHLTALVTPAAQTFDEFLDDCFDDDMIF